MFDKEKAREAFLLTHPEHRHIPKRHLRIQRPRYSFTPAANKQARHKIRNPEKDKARRGVFIALRNGTLKRQPCFCGEEKVDAHHEDYSKPLDVVWLCRKHHWERHLTK